MAMHQPSTRIINTKGDDEPSATRQSSGLPPRRIIKVQGAAGRPESFSRAKDEKVMTVEMDRVGYGDYGIGCLLNYPVDPLEYAQFISKAGICGQPYRF